MQEVTAGPLGEERIASTTAGGTALSTTAALIRLPRVTNHITMVPRNFATAVVAKYHINPWLVILKTTDAMVTAPTDYSNAAQDLSAAAAGVVLSSLDTLANGDFVLVGSHLPIRGVLCDVNATNSTASVLTVHYRKSDDTWADTSATDGTINPAGTTLGADGNVTWTVPTDWKMAKLSAIYTSAPNFPYRDYSLYWTRWSVSAAIDSSVTLDRMLALNRNTANYAELVSGQMMEQSVLHATPGGMGCIEVLTNAGTANLVVNAYTRRDGGFS
jgi:hypothetical protein